MSGRPPLPSASSHDDHNAPYGDPFADRPRQTQFAESTRPYDSTTSLARPFESTASLVPNELGQGATYSDDEGESVEKLPLTSGQTVGHPGGFYPP